VLRELQSQDGKEVKVMVESEYNDEFDIPSFYEEFMYHSVFCENYESEGDEDMDSCITCIHFHDCQNK
jgi:hypothetical protein